MKLYLCTMCASLLLAHELEKEKITHTHTYSDLREITEGQEWSVCPSCSGEVEELNRINIGSLYLETMTEFVNKHQCEVNISAVVDDGIKQEEKSVTFDDLVTYELLEFYFDFTNLAFDGDTLYIEMEIFKAV